MGFLFGKKKKETIDFDVHIIDNTKQDKERVARELEAMKKEWAIEKEKRDATHDKRMAALDFSCLTPGDQPAEFTDVEIEFLEYVDGLKVAKPRIAKRWIEQGVDFQKSLEKFFASGVLQFNDQRTALKITKKGVKIVEKHNKQKRNNLYDEILRYLRENRRVGQLNSYRNNLLTLSHVQHDEGQRNDELKLLLYVCHYDLFGFSSLESYKLAVEYKMEFLKPCPLLASGIIQRIAEAAEALAFTPADVEMFYVIEIHPDLVPPDPIVDIPTSAKLIRMHLEGQGEEADELLKRLTAKYIKAHQK